MPLHDMQGVSGGHRAPDDRGTIPRTGTGVHKRVVLFRAGGRRPVRVFGRRGDLHSDRSCGTSGYLGDQAATCLVLHGKFHSMCRLHSIYVDTGVCVR